MKTFFSELTNGPHDLDVDRTLRVIALSEAEPCYTISTPESTRAATARSGACEVFEARCARSSKAIVGYVVLYRERSQWEGEGETTTATLLRGARLNEAKLAAAKKLDLRWGDPYEIHAAGRPIPGEKMDPKSNRMTRILTAEPDFSELPHAEQMRRLGAKSSPTL